MALSEAAPVPFLQGGNKKLLIGGAWTDAASERRFPAYDPSTGKVIAQLAEGDIVDIDRAVAAARAAFEGPWRRVTPVERQRIIMRFAELVEHHWDEISLLDTTDMGAPIARTRAALPMTLARIRYYAGLPFIIHGETIANSQPGLVLTFTLKEPVGVVGGIIPWNGPTASFVLKICPALATGCTIVLKPAEDASITALRLTELLLEAGLPEGVVNVVTGFGGIAGAALAAHGDVDKLSFTGSHVTGQKIVQASAGNLKRLSLELGGKSPNIVFADADLDAAVPAAAMAGFANSGQICTAGTRLFVHRCIYRDFVERVAAFGQTLRIGVSADPDTQIGPLVSARQQSRVLSYLEIGREEGARAVSGGGRVKDHALNEGYFVEPTVFADVDNGMRIAREEIFGPVISAIPFDDTDDVIRQANDNLYGLAAGVWTRNVGLAHRMSQELRTGTVWINCYMLVDPAVPFGGYKMSGMGRESGMQHVEEFLNIKSVWLNSTVR